MKQDEQASAGKVRARDSDGRPLKYPGVGRAPIVVDPLDVEVAALRRDGWMVESKTWQEVIMHRPTPTTGFGNLFAAMFGLQKRQLALSMRQQRIAVYRAGRHGRAIKRRRLA